MSVPVVRVAITGRITEPAVHGVAEALRGALAQPGRFAVLLDRSAMTAPTPGGRAALEQMAELVMPLLPGRCTAWADLYDERRAASFKRAAADDDADDADGADAARSYPQRTFADEQAALTWIQQQTKEQS